MIRPNFLKVAVFEIFRRRNLFKKFIFSLVLFFAVNGFFLSTSQAATIRISAPKVQLELAPGETYSGEITAENPADEEVKAKIYLEDWAYKEGGTGEKNFLPPGTTPLSAAKWITFAPAEDVIKPFGRVVARYTVTVPKDAKGGYYAVLFFETVLGSIKDDEGVNVMVAGRIGSLFYVTVKGNSERSGDITSVEIPPFEGNKPLQIHTAFHNTGDLDITLGGNFLIMSDEGKILGRGDVSKIYTFPGESATGKTEWVGRLPAGKYSVLLTYDLGKGKSLVEEKTLTVS